MKMDLIEGSETSAIINQTPGNYPKENLLYSVHGESLKSRKWISSLRNFLMVEQAFSMTMKTSYDDVKLPHMV